MPAEHSYAGVESANGSNSAADRRRLDNEVQQQIGKSRVMRRRPRSTAPSAGRQQRRDHFPKWRERRQYDSINLAQGVRADQIGQVAAATGAVVTTTALSGSNSPSRWAANGHGHWCLHRRHGGGPDGRFGLRQGSSDQSAASRFDRERDHPGDRRCGVLDHHGGTVASTSTYGCRSTAYRFTLREHGCHGQTLTGSTVATQINLSPARPASRRVSQPPAHCSDRF